MKKQKAKNERLASDNFVFGGMDRPSVYHLPDAGSPILRGKFQGVVDPEEKVLK